MKNFLALTLLFGSAILFVPSAEAKTAGTNSITAIEINAAPQIYTQRRRNRNWNQRRMRVVTRVRIVRVGYRTYREIWQYRYFANGRVTSRLLSRTRIR